MKSRFTLFRRGPVFYCQDNTTGQQTSLRTKNEDEAHALLHSRNEAFRQPILNLQIARTYLSASDPQVAKRTWQMVMDEMGKTKHGPTKTRHDRGMRDTAFNSIRKMPLLETQAHHFLHVLSVGTVSTNMFLVRLHNFALQMNWLPWPILARKRWPKISFHEKRAVTWDEHQAILAREENPEKRAYFECCWHLGGAQSDIASLTAENIDWQNRIVSFHRKKTRTPSIVRFGEALERVLRELPRFGPLFPSVIDKPETDRSRFSDSRASGQKFPASPSIRIATRGPNGPRSAGIPSGSHRKRWGTPAKPCIGRIPKKAQVTLPALEDYERKQALAAVVPMPRAPAS
jgi:integrase